MSDCARQHIGCGTCSITASLSIRPSPAGVVPRPSVAAVALCRAGAPGSPAAAGGAGCAVRPTICSGTPGGAAAMPAHAAPAVLLSSRASSAARRRAGAGYCSGADAAAAADQRRRYQDRAAPATAATLAGAAVMLLPTTIIIVASCALGLSGSAELSRRCGTCAGVCFPAGPGSGHNYDQRRCAK